jgi:hypothetical protein
MASNISGLPIAVVLALSYQASANASPPASTAPFEGLSAMIADGSLPVEPGAGLHEKDVAQWFNFNQWNNCISGTWRNC